MKYPKSSVLTEIANALGLTEATAYVKLSQGLVYGVVKAGKTWRIIDGQTPSLKPVVIPLPGGADETHVEPEVVEADLPTEEESRRRKLYHDARKAKHQANISERDDKQQAGDLVKRGTLDKYYLGLLETVKSKLLDVPLNYKALHGCTDHQMDDLDRLCRNVLEETLQE